MREILPGQFAACHLRDGGAAPILPETTVSPRQTRDLAF